MADDKSKTPAQGSPDSDNILTAAAKAIGTTLGTLVAKTGLVHPDPTLPREDAPATPTVPTVRKRVAKKSIKKAATRGPATQNAAAKKTRASRVVSAKITRKSKGTAVRKKH